VNRSFVNVNFPHTKSLSITSVYQQTTNGAHCYKSVFQCGRLTGGSPSNAHNFKIGTHPDKNFASSIAARRDAVSINSAINCNHPQKPVVITRYSPITNDITQQLARMRCFSLACHFSTNHIYASSFTFLSTLVVSISFPSRTAHG
jgi:hypothetical protein